MVMIGATPVPRAAEVVATELRNAIVRGELTADDSLPAEAALMERFEVSRPTLREAIRILESENLIRVSRGPRGGARIMAFTSELAARAVGQTLQASRTTLRDIFEARLTIEPPAARMAAERRPHEAALGLRRQILEEYAAIGDNERVARAASGFYRMLIEYSGNQTLALLGATLQIIIEKHLSLIGRNINDWEPEAVSAERQRAGFVQQGRMVDFIEAGDGAAAEDHWRMHVEHSAAYWLHGPLADATLEILDRPEGFGLRPGPEV